jgi:hypothetical protein
MNNDTRPLEGELIQADTSSSKARGGQLGNTNAASHKLWYDTLQKELKSGKRGNVLARLANQLIGIALGENGESGSTQLQALAHIAERLDGKPKQAIDVSVNTHDMTIDQLR